MTAQQTAIDWESAHRRLRESQRALDLALSPDDERVRTILTARARMLAQRHVERPTAERVHRYLLMRARSNAFLLDLTHVAEVGSVERCTPVPGGPPHLAGVFTRRGEVHSLIDLGVLLGTEPPEGVCLGCFVHLRPPNGHSTAAGVWLRVDDLDRVVEISPSQINPADTRPGADESNFVRCVEGVAHDGAFVLHPATLWEIAASSGTPHPSVPGEAHETTNINTIASTPANAGISSEAHP